TRPASSLTVRMRAAAPARSITAPSAAPPSPRHGRGSADRPSSPPTRVACASALPFAPGDERLEDLPALQQLERVVELRVGAELAFLDVRHVGGRLPGRGRHVLQGPVLL